MTSMQDGASIDFTTMLGLLNVIAHTFTKIEHTSTEALEFIETVNDFVYKEGTGITSKICKLPQNQIKEIKDAEIISVVRAYYDLTGSEMSKEAFATRFQLDLLLIFLQSPYIEKKLSALNEIKKLFDKKNKVGKDVSSEQLAEWLSDCKIIDYIYKEAKHPELISRSTELLSNLAINNRLNKETIEMLWETCINEHKHEAVAEATLNVIASLAKILPPDMINSFVEHIQNLSLSILGEYISIFKTFYLN